MHLQWCTKMEKKHELSLHCIRSNRIFFPFWCTGFSWIKLILVATCLVSLYFFKFLGDTMHPQHLENSSSKKSKCALDGRPGTFLLWRFRGCWCAYPVTKTSATLELMCSCTRKCGCGVSMGTLGSRSNRVTVSLQRGKITTRNTIARTNHVYRLDDDSMPLAHLPTHQQLFYMDLHLRKNWSVGPVPEGRRMYNTRPLCLKHIGVSVNQGLSAMDPQRSQFVCFSAQSFQEMCGVDSTWILHLSHMCWKNLRTQDAHQNFWG